MGGLSPRGHLVLRSPICSSRRNRGPGRAAGVAEGPCACRTVIVLFCIYLLCTHLSDHLPYFLLARSTRVLPPQGDVSRVLGPEPDVHLKKPKSLLAPFPHPRGGDNSWKGTRTQPWRRCLLNIRVQPGPSLYLPPASSVLCRNQHLSAYTSIQTPAIHERAMQMLMQVPGSPRPAWKHPRCRLQHGEAPRHSPGSSHPQQSLFKMQTNFFYPNK